jgi:hypothetical protein
VRIQSTSAYGGAAVGPSAGGGRQAHSGESAFTIPGGDPIDQSGAESSNSSRNGIVCSVMPSQVLKRPHQIGILQASPYFFKPVIETLS